jgi:hypothetical protein
MENEITVQWYTVEYPLPEEDEEDYCPEQKLANEGEAIFDEPWLDNSLIAQVVEYLHREGAVYPSAGFWHAGIWYMSDPYHLQDVSDRTSQEVWAVVTRRACVWHLRDEEESEVAV